VAVLALGELRTLAGLVQTDLLTLDGTGVSGQEAGFAKRAMKLVVIGIQGTGDTVTNGASLTGGATTTDGDLDVDLVAHCGNVQRLAYNHAGGLTTEVLIQGAVVYHDIAAAGGDEHTSSGAFAASGSIKRFCHDLDLKLLSQISSASGCWA